MSRRSPVSLAWEMGAPVLTARELLRGQDGATRLLRRRLASGQWMLPLPQGCPEGAAVEDLTGRAQPWSPGREGVYCLAIRTLGERVVGVPNRLLAAKGEAAHHDSFTAACQHGQQLALDWLLKTFGLVTLPDPRRFEVLPLTGALAEQGSQGESAGLAAALAAAWTWLGGAPEGGPLAVAATGRVDGRGNIEDVDELQAKVEGALREVPDIQQIYIPRANREVLPPALEARVVRVKTVAQALDHLMASHTSTVRARLAPDKAAKAAQWLERNKQHLVAFRLADAVLETLEGNPCETPDLLRARTVARSVRAINLCHRGETARARRELDAIEQELSDAPREVREGFDSADYRALMAAREASVAIDELAYEEAVAVCQRLEDQLSAISPGPRMELLGSWSRALACMGEMEQAEERSRQQRAFTLTREESHQHPQRLCNLMDILCRRHLRGEPGMIQRLADTLDQARQANELVCDRMAQRANAGYLDLWECRLCALTGQADRALELAGELAESPDGHYPLHYFHRFAGEALARAGELEHALTRLDAAVATISDKAKEFERLILLSAGASASLLRLTEGMDGWRDQAAAFFDALNSHREGFVSLPARTAEPDAWRAALGHALSRLPY